jgi:hypothetical protein
MKPRILLLAVLTGLAATALLAPDAYATIGGGQLTLTQQIRVFFDDWIGPIATMFAVAGLIFGLIQIGLGRGPDAFGNAVRWLVVVAMVVGILVILGQSGITAATV